MRGARSTLAAGLSVIGLWLQGCEEPECPGAYEALVLWTPDWARLDELAGCRGGWSPSDGWPCASDVPIPFAKKGAYAEDEAWMLEGATNSRGSCLERSDGGACRSWWHNKMGCERDEFEVCNCTDESLSGRYCSTWRCLAHQINHYQCWEAEWDATYETECDIPGNEPLVLNVSTYFDLLQAEGSAMSLQYDHASALYHMRSRGRKTYRFQNVAVTTAKVFRKSQEPAVSWRYIFPKYYTCACTHAWQGEHFCAQWHCDGDAEVYHPERLEFSCIEGFQVNTTGPLAYPDATHRCGAWEGSRILWETAELEQCRAFTHPNISEWACTSFSQPRIVEFRNTGHTSIFHERVLHALVHLTWITAIVEVAILVGLILVTRSSSHWDRYLARIAGTYVCAALAALLIWLIAFVRDTKDKQPLARNERLAPGAAFGGCLLVVTLAWLLAVQTVVVRQWSGKWRGNRQAAMLVAFGATWGICMTYACGLVIGGVFFLPVMVCLGIWTYQGLSERLYGQAQKVVPSPR